MNLRFTTARIYRYKLMFLSICLLSIMVPAYSQAAPGDVDFTTSIRPILQKHCASCHSGEDAKHGYRVDIRAVGLRGGDSGEPAIVPGKPEASHVYRLISDGVNGLTMPYKKSPLPESEVALIKAWIEQGAKWPDDGIEAPKVEPLWSLQPVNKPQVPSQAIQYPGNAIDAFIARKLREAGLQQSAPADRSTQIRRAFFKLHGLPPTPAQFKQYGEDQREDWYERMIDDLLASPRYGERWGRHWLDLARFAETNGFETNTPRGSAWHYRDYVIDSFNKDTPYNEFVIEQIAGDAVGAPRGTGFLVAGPWDEVKSPDVLLTRTQRSNELADMINATSTTFLGLTVACARCHNHKFDPILQKDFYAMEAVFAGVNHGNSNISMSSDPEEQKKELAYLQEQLSEYARQYLERQIEAVPYAQVAEEGKEFDKNRPPVHVAQNVDRFKPIKARYIRFTIDGTNGGPPCIDELEIYSPNEDGKGYTNVALASSGAKASASSALAGYPIHRIEHLNDGKHGNDYSWIPIDISGSWAMIELPEITTVTAVMWGRDRQEGYTDRLATAYRIEVAIEPGKWKTVADGRDRTAYPGHQPFDLVGSLGNDLPAEERERLMAVSAEVQSIRLKIAQSMAGTQAYVGSFSQPGPTHRLYRGDVMAPREPVVADIPETFGSLELEPDTPEQQRRLALARWIGSEDNPLTARVMVNRIWQYHFGEGLVNTPSDFGRNGVKPTHPELLDYLASEFIANGWSIKHMQKLVMTSHAYRQSARPNVKAMQVDAGSRLLWRFPPHRHEAEVIRDSMLRITDKLRLEMGGPGYSVFKDNSNYVRNYQPKETFGPAEWRRMVYMFNVRMEQDATFGAFDCPDGGQVAPDRPRSTTALQALNLLNSPFILQQADIFADRLKKEAGDDPAAQVKRAFVIAFNREPGSEELSSSVAFIQMQGLPSFCRAIFNVNEFLFVQ